MKKGQLTAMIRKRARKGGVISVDSFNRADRRMIQRLLNHMKWTGELEYVERGKQGRGGCNGKYRALHLRVGDCLQPGRPKLNLSALPVDGEISLKAWVHQEAARSKISPAGIFSRYYKGLYHHLKIRRANARVVFVKT